MWEVKFYKSIKKRKKKRFKLSKFKKGDECYIYKGGCLSVIVLDVYLENGEWIYEIDCSYYKKGLELIVPEPYLGRHSNPRAYNKHITPSYMKKFAEEMED